MSKYHQGAATWFVFEGQPCQFVERGTGKREGQLLLRVSGWPT